LTGPRIDIGRDNEGNLPDEVSRDKTCPGPQLEDPVGRPRLGEGGIEEEAGVLLKNIEDVPYPSANALAVWHLMRLYFITGNEEYRSLAERSLVYFAGRAKKAGLYAGTYFSVLDGLCNYLALRVEAPAGSGLAQAALWAFRPYKMLSYGAGSDIVVPCVKGKCLEPLRSPEAVRQLVADNKIPAPPA
jgi:uncharacterized protein YyaL (SSP411 family)